MGLVAKYSKMVVPDGKIDPLFSPVWSVLVTVADQQLSVAKGSRKSHMAPHRSVSHILNDVRVLDSL